MTGHLVNSGYEANLPKQDKASLTDNKCTKI